MGALSRFFSWLLRKAAFALVLALMVFATLALRMYVRERVDFSTRKAEAVRGLTAEVARINQGLTDVDARKQSMTRELAGEVDRAERATRISRELKDQNSGLNRLTADSAQVKMNDDRITRLELLVTDSQKRAAEFEGKLKQAQWERDGLEMALERTQAQLQTAQAEQSETIHYVRETWGNYGNYILIGIAAYFLGYPVTRLLIFYVFAPIVSSRAPVVLGPASAPTPEVQSSRTALDVAIRPGEKLWVRENFLQASDEGLKKRTKTMLSLAMPITCGLARLTELIQLHNKTPDLTFHVTLSSENDQMSEVALVTVAEGASMILRPSFLAGAVSTSAGKLRIRRRWRIFKLQSWVTGRFRYLEFIGPCRLLVAGNRGVRVEVLNPADGNPRPARRVNQDAMIGFTPGLAYRPVRAETFWAYLRGMNPLFDDLFAGRGLFLCQANSAREAGAKGASATTGFRYKLARILGV